MIEKSVVTAHAFGARALRRAFEETQRRERALRGLLARDVAALDADAVGGQSEADRGDAGKRLGVGIPIRNEPGIRIGGVPEVVERAVLEIVEERRQRRFEQRRDDRARRFSFVVAAGADEENGGEKGGEKMSRESTAEVH